MATSPTVNYVKYNGTLLMRGSQAFTLYEKQQFKELEEHLKFLDAQMAKITAARK